MYSLYLRMALSSLTMFWTFSLSSAGEAAEFNPRRGREIT
jgi:hypothetical protein